MRANRRLRRNIVNILLIISVTVVMLPGCRSSHKSRDDKGYAKSETFRLEKNHFKKDSPLVDEAMTWLGTPYCYAKSDKGEGTDCSGMVMKVYENVTGIKIPRNSAKQADFCRCLDKKDVTKGDLVFFATGKDPERISHVGIMIDESNFIHASTKKGVIISRIDTPYYTRTFRMFGRPEMKE